MMYIHKAALWFFTTAAYAGILLILIGAWLAFHNVPTIVINNFKLTDVAVIPVHIETPVVHPGDVIVYELDYCKYTDIIPIARRQLIDGQTIPLTASNGNGSGLPLGCHKTTRSVEIPETINPGRYYLNVYLDYQINRFRTQRVSYYTEYFQVVGPEIPSTSKPAPKLGTEVYPAPADARIQQ